MKTEKVPKTESRLDSLFWVESPDGPYILNIEPQGYKDKATPTRMLRYRADIWEYTMSKDRSTPRINQAVIFYFPEHDNERNTLNDDWQGKLTIDYNYEVIKVWELKKELKLIIFFPLNSSLPYTATYINYYTTPAFQAIPRGFLFLVSYLYATLLSCLHF